MHQNKEYTITFTVSQKGAARLEELKETLIQQGIPSGHTIYLQAPGYDDLPVGNWSNLHCGYDDLELATSLLISW